MQLHDTQADGTAWPLIGIVTPNYNHAEFIEETLRSVLLQGYPNIDYVVVDGGSTDGSVDIIKKYAPWLTHWESEHDRGQSHALNKGFARTCSELVAWMNSSDFYLPGGLAAMARLAGRRPDAVVLMGGCRLLYVDGTSALQVPQAEGFLDFLDPVRNQIAPPVYQPAHLWRGDRFRAVGPVDEDEHMSMDVDLVLRLLEVDRIAACMPDPVAATRFHADQKSGDPLAAAAGIHRTQWRRFCAIKTRLQAEERQQVGRNLRRALAQLELHRFSASGRRDLRALLRALLRDPLEVLAQARRKARTGRALIRA